LVLCSIDCVMIVFIQFNTMHAYDGETGGQVDGQYCVNVTLSAVYQR